jgi:hypothetical protein
MAFSNSVLRILNCSKWECGCWEFGAAAAAEVADCIKTAAEVIGRSLTQSQPSDFLPAHQPLPHNVHSIMYSIGDYSVCVLFVVSLIWIIDFCVFATLGWSVWDDEVWGNRDRHLTTNKRRNKDKEEIEQREGGKKKNLNCEYDSVSVTVSASLVHLLTLCVYVFFVCVLWRSNVTSSSVLTVQPPQSRSCQWRLKQTREENNKKNRY